MKACIPRQLRAKILRCCFAVTGLAGFASNGLAGDRSWTNTSGGVFSTSSNWLKRGRRWRQRRRELRELDGLFQAAYTVTFSAAQTNQAIKVKKDYVTFDLSGRTYTTTLLSGTEIGDIGTGFNGRSARLTIQNGTFSTASNALVAVAQLRMRSARSP